MNNLNKMRHEKIEATLTIAQTDVDCEIYYEIQDKEFKVEIVDWFDSNFDKDTLRDVARSFACEIEEIKEIALDKLNEEIPEKLY